MERSRKSKTRRGTVLLMIVGLLAMLFILITAYLTLAQLERSTLRLASRGEQVDQIIDSSNDVLCAAVRGAWGSDAEEDLVSGENYVTIPGYRAGRWLASPELVRDPDSQNYGPEDYGYPATSNLGGTDASEPKPLTELMRDHDRSGGVAINPVGGTPRARDFADDLDTLGNTREPWMDAMGTGMPDADFAQVAVLTELANAMAGTPVGAVGMTPADLDDASAFAAWRHFDDIAQYAVAARIVSHGGMVNFGTEEGAEWNAEFARRMFNWVEHPRDQLKDSLASTDQDLMELVAAHSALIEPLLRRRGGLLGSGSGMGDLVPGLEELEGRFGYTFNPEYGQHGLRKDNDWQRFCLADSDDWEAFRRAATIDPDLYNIYAYPDGSGTSEDPRLWYVPRQILTTVSNSDELARELDSGYTWAPDAMGETLGIDAGITKFYLGRIAEAFDERSGLFKPGEGSLVIAELARYYHEMLSAHDWSDEAGQTGDTEAMKRRRQAYMLAVNTVAFAAPRGQGGYIDAVYYDDGDAGSMGGSGYRYIGYAPQPFITQAVIYNDPSQTGSNERIALALELYNPHDSAGTLTDHDLDLSTFAISIGDLSPVAFDETLGSMRGREFKLFAVHGGDPGDPGGGGHNRFFELQVGQVGTPEGYAVDGTISLDVPYTEGRNIDIKLWRLDKPLGGEVARRYLVDKMEVEMEERSGTPLREDEEWYVGVQRDSRPDFHIGLMDGRPAAWRMAVAFPPPSSGAGGAGSDRWYRNTVVKNAAPGVNLLYELGNGWLYEDAGQTYKVAPFGPSVPLYTMNARLGSAQDQTVLLHGASRPSSFPTTGYMLFVPRFTHVERFDHGVPTWWKPITEVLYDQWEEKEYGGVSGGGSVASVPADFGHMPIFDNQQEVENNSLFDSDRCGSVPWGLLVYDYFTTLNPDGEDGTPGTDDDIDPYRVPGRININTASWYVLAGLPIIRPDELRSVYWSGGNGRLQPSWSLWSVDAGVLGGLEPDGVTQRFAPEGVVYSDGWSRLGAYLGQAAAAYRDREKYASSSTSPFAIAHERSAGTYRPIIYGGVRRQNSSDSSDQRGFLTVGELANVMGFDSTPEETFMAGGGATATVLGGYNQQLGGDFVKAVSLMALLDTHYVTTRSNTFTVYVTLTDRTNPQATIRSQITVDRSNLLPRLIRDQDGDEYTTLRNNGLPTIIGQREVSYFNARYDE